MNDPLLQALRQAEQRGVPIPEVPTAWRPATLEAAYAIARAFTAGRGPRAGWKIGATGLQGQRVLHLDEPFFGRIHKREQHYSPALVGAGDRVLALEPEVAFEMGSTLPGRPRPYTADDVRTATRAFVPALEINWPPYERPFDVGGLALIAANGVNAGVVLGTPRPVPPDAELLEIEATLEVDGVEQGRGRCAEVLGPPFAALAWLANALCVRGEALHAGDVVCVGALSRPAQVAAGHAVRADFGVYGLVEARLSR